jgi:catechol 2,3-dioxygenase-like lactoylglutathione lyase family enzyme
MLKGIDHVVIAVPELEEAIRHYGSVGFKVVPGGKHSIGTHNALIAFHDGTYIELIAFLTPITSHPWYKALQTGGGLVDFCMMTDDLEGDVAAIVRAGAAMGVPSSMTRKRPDGYELRWELAIPAPPWNGRLPFLIRDHTPRSERVPREHEHPNGIAGIRGVTIAVNDPHATATIYRGVLGAAGEKTARDDLDAAGIAFTIGAHRIELVAPKSDSSPIAKWIRAHGETPFEAKLISTIPASEQIDPILLRRARLGIA